eukprot:2381775-Pyramimonas_sp.AAC.1
MATATTELQERWTSANSKRLGDFVSLLGSLLEHHVAAADLWVAPSGFPGASANRERQELHSDSLDLKVLRLLIQTRTRLKKRH